ncbi:MAG: hypothetical protein FWC68_00355 [Oscillospiraceae bacterium]|nr:hypothetical protein [Oscillospiraceae bacterium]
MAKNPMQKKVTNAFILGVIITLMVAIGIGALGYVILVLPNQAAARDSSLDIALREVFVITAPVNAGDELRLGLNVEIESIQTGIAVSVEPIDGRGNPARARIDLEPGTVITNSMLMGEFGEIGDDVRYIEFNMLTLPIGVNIGDFIDVRLTLPNGTDFIVVSKQPIIDINGETVTLRLSETEILMMQAAIIESYIIRASNLHVVRYVEPGIQEAATPTYQVDPVIRNLIARSQHMGNISYAVAREILAGQNEELRGFIEEARRDYESDRVSNVEQGISSQIERAREAREQFLRMAMPID